MQTEYAKYLLEKTRKDYDLVSREFSRTREKPWPELGFLFRDVEKGEQVLDLGCGNGRYFDFLKDKDVKYQGVDFSKALIDLAKEKYPQADFLAADAFNLPFSDNFFDKIYSIAVFHHIPSTELRLEFLKEAKRVLKPGGKIILTVWKFGSGKRSFLMAKNFFLKLFGLSNLDPGDALEPWFEKGERYYHLFSKEELAYSAKRAGFKIKEAGVVRSEKGFRQNIYFIAQKPAASIDYVVDNLGKKH